MRVKSSGGYIRLILLVAVLVGAVGLQSAARRSFKAFDKATYVDPKVIDFVRPGLVFAVVGAQIGSDGTVSAHVKVTDPQGLPLDRSGVNTPGTVSMSFIVATIPSGKTQYTAYTFRTATAASGGATATQASADSGGTFTANADGDYLYTFKIKAPSGYDATATHTIGVYGSRDLTSFGLDVYYASTTYNFVPNGSAVKAVRDVVRNGSCTTCHDVISFHGGSRVGTALCIMCHQPQTSDPNTGNVLDFPIMIHKIHFGSGLPSVRSGKPYQIVGFGNAVSDFSDVVFPADPGANAGKNSVTGLSIVNGGVQRCGETCHTPTSGATQASNFLSNPTRAACGACHDDVNFFTGQNHVNLPQPDDNECKMCHQPQGEIEFDASILGAHTIPTESTQLGGINFKIASVTGTPGTAPVVTFSVLDNSGNPVAMSELHSTGRLALVLAGPTTDYGYTNFGATTPGYVSEDPTTSSNCSANGTCIYTFTHKLPANATGTYSVGIEGRRTQTLNPGTEKQIANVQYGGKNVVYNFSVDGSSVTPRRNVVALTNCNSCHVSLSLHGENRNQIEMCVLCHNPSDTDASTRATSTIAAQKNAPPQGINFSLLVHKIHTGAAQAAQGTPYQVVGFGGALSDFSTVVFPTFHPNGSVGDVQKCYMCHVNSSEDNLPVGLNNVVDPQGLLNPAPATTSACTACHNDRPTFSHAVANTTAFGESCTVCHAAGAQFAADKVHAE